MKAIEKENLSDQKLKIEEEQNKEKMIMNINKQY